MLKERDIRTFDLTANGAAFVERVAEKCVRFSEKNARKIKNREQVRGSPFRELALVFRCALLFRPVGDAWDLRAVAAVSESPGDIGHFVEQPDFERDRLKTETE